MLKKILVLTVVLMMLAGCGQNRVTYVAVLEKTEENKAAIAFADEEGKMIFSEEIPIPSEVYFGDNAVYYSEDYSLYKSISFETFKPADTLNDVSGFILYHDQKTCSVIYNGLGMAFMKDGKTVKEYDWNGADFFRAYKGRLYVSGQNVLRIFDLTTYELIKELYMKQSVYHSITEIAGKIYVVLDMGLMDVEDGTTYVYPTVIDSVVNCRGNVLAVSQNGEINMYYISFDSYGMLLEDNFDDQLAEMDFEKMFSEYYEKGYEAVYFQDYLR